MAVSVVPCWGCAVVLLVSTSPCFRVLCAMFFALHRPLLQRCAKKFALRHCGHRVSAKKFAQHTKNGPKWGFYGALGEFFRGPAVVGSRRASLLRRVPGSRALLLTVLTLQCAAKPYWWHGGQPAQATIHRVNVRMKGPKPPAVGLSVATGCNVWRLGAARRRSGVMFGWLCSRVRTATPRPRPGGASRHPTIRRSAKLPAWRTSGPP